MILDTNNHTLRFYTTAMHRKETSDKARKIYKQTRRKNCNITCFIIRNLGIQFILTTRAFLLFLYYTSIIYVIHIFFACRWCIICVLSPCVLCVSDIFSVILGKSHVSYYEVCILYTHTNTG